MYVWLKDDLSRVEVDRDGAAAARLQGVEQLEAAEDGVFPLPLAVRGDLQSVDEVA